MSKVFCFGDIHFGSSRYPFIREQEDRLVEWVLENVDRYGCRHVVVVGDLFKDRVPDVRDKDRVYLVLVELSKEVEGRGGKVFVVAGNHDYYDKGCSESGVMIYRGIDGLRVVDYGVERFEVDGVGVCFVPWSWLVGEERERTYELVRGSVVFTHAEFRELVEWEGREQVSVDLFGSARLVVSGHLHLKRQLRNVVYVGVPFQRNFGDGEPGGLVVDLKTGEWFRVGGYGVRFVQGLREDLRGCVVRVGREEEVEEAMRRGAVVVEYVPEPVRSFGGRVEVVGSAIDLKEVVREYGKRVLKMDDKEVEYGLKVLEEVRGGE